MTKSPFYFCLLQRWDLWEFKCHIYCIALQYCTLDIHTHTHVRSRNGFCMRFCRCLRWNLWNAFHRFSVPCVCVCVGCRWICFRCFLHFSSMQVEVVPVKVTFVISFCTHTIVDYRCVVCSVTAICLYGLGLSICMNAVDACSYLWFRTRLYDRSCDVRLVSFTSCPPSSCDHVHDTVCCVSAPRVRREYYVFTEGLLMVFFIHSKK